MIYVESFYWFCQYFDFGGIGIGTQYQYRDILTSLAIMEAEKKSFYCFCQYFDFGVSILVLSTNTETPGIKLYR